VGRRGVNMTTSESLFHKISPTCPQALINLRNNKKYIVQTAELARDIKIARIKWTLVILAFTNGVPVILSKKVTFNNSTDGDRMFFSERLDN
jgi:hypothetical protein